MNRAVFYMDTYDSEETTTDHDIISSSTDVMPAPMPWKSFKRPFFKGRYDADGPPAKRRSATIPLGEGVRWNLNAVSAAAAAVELEGRSPVSVLNEMGTSVVYRTVRESGPPHCPSFTISVTVAQMTFEGWGRSKREARTAAARACLAALRARAGCPAPPPPVHIDFTADVTRLDNTHASNDKCADPGYGQLPYIDLCGPSTVSSSTTKIVESPAKWDTSPAEPAPPPPPPPPATRRPPPAPSKSPINCLYEAHPGIVFRCTYGDGTPLEAARPPMVLGHSQRFKVVCTVSDKTFEGYGASKKLAKLAAARAATASLLEGGAPAPAAFTPADAVPQTVADLIGRLVNEKFRQLVAASPAHAKRKVLAGVVMTIDNQLEGAKVIAVTTGTKCISGEHLSVRGLAVNDSHAEVVARRCLQRFLYEQLRMYARADDGARDIAASDLAPAAGGGYRLRADRRLHLYVSTAPCGDGRIFSPHEKPEPEPDKHPNRMARGLLRTKIESGEGTIPVKNSQNEVQTWDGVLQGERLLTMSCSDKLARWCVVGLQGALLSSFLRPVYYHSVVLGSLLHPQHLYRAICGRVEGTLEALPRPYRLQRPLLARAASAEARTPARAPNFAVNWCAGQPEAEVVNAATGKLDGGAPSGLCKQAMFARWHGVARRLPPLPQEDESGRKTVNIDRSQLDGISYEEAKLLCPAYQQAKERLKAAFLKAGLGRWVNKPLEQDQFYCERTAGADSPRLMST